MNRIIRPLAFAAIVLSVAVPTRAQDLGETLQGVGASYAEAYVQPLVNAFGADINSGLFHTAKIGGGMLPLVDLYIGVKVFGALVPSSDQTLDLTYVTEERFTAPDGNDYLVDVLYEIRDAPTVFGDTDNAGVATASVNEVVDAGPDGQMGTGDDVVINEQAELNLLSGIINTSIAPLIVPQVRIGSAFGTDVMFRYLPRIGMSDVGSVGFFGLGVRHSLSQYIPLFPIDVAAQLTYQSLNLQDSDDTDVLGASMWAVSAIASKSFFVASVYGGLQLESTSMDVEYLFVDPNGELPDQQISFSMDGSNRFRAVAGVVLHTGPVAINVDYSLGSISVLSAGVGLSL